MSICIACASPEGLILASDTGSFMGQRVYHSGFKWRQIHGWWITQTGPATLIQAIEFAEDPVGENISALIPWIRRQFALNGVHPNQSTGPEDYDCQIIAVRGKRVWLLDGLLLAEEVPEGKWCAIGSGDRVAIGALEAFEIANVPWSPSDVARQVINIVTDNIHTTRGCEVRVVPYHTMETKVTPLPGRRENMTIDR